MIFVPTIFLYNLKVQNVNLLILVSNKNHCGKTVVFIYLVMRAKGSYQRDN